jgi:hypothetical protein
MSRRATRDHPESLELAFFRTPEGKRTGSSYCAPSARRRGKNAGELRSETEPELLNDAIFGAIYYRFLLRSGPLTGEFGEELVEQIIRGHRLEPGRGRPDRSMTVRRRAAVK